TIFNDVLRGLAVNPVDVPDPPTSALGCAVPHGGRAIEIEARCAVELDPSAVGYEAVLDQHRLAGSPSHLFDGMILIKPSTGRYELWLSFIIDNRLTVFAF